MPKLNQIVNGEYIGANKYIIKEDGNGKSTIDFSPDEVFKPGTPVGAEILNEIQKNGLYQLSGIKNTVAEEDIYDCSLEGIDTFEFEELNILLKPDKNSEKENVFIKLNEIKYKIISNTGNTSEIFANQNTGLTLKKSTLQAIKWDMSVPVVDNLKTQDSKKALSANMGYELENKKANNSITITGTGALKGGGDLTGNREISHKTDPGYNHIPAAGEEGSFLKWLSNGVGQWAKIAWNDITGKPSTFPPSSHTHTKNQITDFAHTHDDRYYTEAEIDTKFKNFSLVAVPVGGVLAMYNNTNPAELYSGTTWELITSSKYIQSGNTPLQTGGSNSVTIAKANLPNIKLKIDSHSHTQPAHTHGAINYTPYYNASGGGGKHNISDSLQYTTSSAGGENTGSSAPYTEALGSGTALNIQPAYITLKFWKRLT